MNSAFSPLALVVSEQFDSDNLRSYASSVEGSLFVESLDFLINCRKQVNDLNKQYYKSLHESAGNYILVHESFSGFFDGIKAIITKIIDFIKSLAKKFITKLHSFIKSETYLKKHKDELNKFTNIHEFKFSGYEFNFPAGVPVLTVLTTFAKEMESVNLNNYANTVATDGKSKNAVIAASLKDKYDALIRDLDDRFYDRIRAEVMGKHDDYVNQSDYAKELFELFHGSSGKEDIEINSSKVQEFYARFENSKKFKTEVEKDSKRIENEYKNIKKQIESAMKRSADGKTIDIDMGDDPNVVGFAVDKDIMSVIDLFIKAKANQVQEMSNIHILAFSAKLDAIADCLKQDKTVLYQALYKVQGVKKAD